MVGSFKLLILGLILVALFLLVVSNRSLSVDRFVGVSSSAEESNNGDGNDDVRNLSYVNRPRIWIVQFLSPRQKECDISLQIASYWMFNNELLFDRILWIVDNDDVFTKDDREGMEEDYPYPIVTYAPMNKRIKEMCSALRVASRVEMCQQQLRTLFLDVFVEDAARAKRLKPPDVLAIVRPDTQMTAITTLRNVFPEGGRGIFYSDKKIWSGEAPQLKAMGVTSDAFGEGTELFLKYPQIGDFSESIPVYVYRDTLKKLRQKVESIHSSRAFLDVVENVAKSKTPFKFVFCFPNSIDVSPYESID